MFEGFSGVRDFGVYGLRGFRTFMGFRAVGFEGVRFKGCGGFMIIVSRM